MRHARERLREDGVVATARRTIRWTLRRLRGVPAGGQPLASPPFEVAVPFVPERARASAPLERGRVFVQELATGYDEIESVELLARTRGRPVGGPIALALRAADGSVLASRVVETRGLADNAYLRAGFDPPVRIDAGAPVFLALAAPDATRETALSFWTTTPGRGRLWIEEGDAAGSPGLPTSEPAPGSLVWRVRSTARRDDPVYRWPPLPAGMGVDTTRVGALGEIGATLGDALPLRSVRAAHDRIVAGEIDVLLMEALPWTDEIRALLARAAERHVPVACRLDASRTAIRPHEPPPDATSRNWRDPNTEPAARRRTAVAAGFALVANADDEAAARADRKRTLPLVPGATAQSIGRAAIDAYLQLHRPRVSIVTILYNKAAELPHVLASYAAQTYAGEIEIVCVDDCSPDDSVAVVERFAAELGRGERPGRPLAVRIVRNERNSGNCLSREAGIAAASGAILVVIDADCMLNRDFVKRHVEAHAFDDCEVVIGPLNIETKGGEPQAVLAAYEADPALAMANAELQDPRNPASFLNCITRNVSYKREAIRERLFDPLFSYSADPSTGFGWEDVEMAWRLYAAGARIKFVTEAYSIHVTPPLAPEGRKPVRSLLNFRRLFETHPDLALVARGWAEETYARIDAWAKRSGFDVTDEERRLEPFLGPPRAPAVHTTPRRLRVLSCRWHVPHQYELWRLPLDVTLVTGLGNPMIESWDYGQRPLPANARFRHVDEIDPRRFDLAILHFDENVLAPQNTNGVIGPEWGAAFKYLHGLAGLPKVAICHGTPQFHGQYDIDYAGADLMQPIEAERARLVDFLGDIPVVCNSHQAEAEWRFRRSRTIWHGFDPSEFPPATYERGILSPVGPLVLSRPHYRGWFLYRKVFDGHHAELRPETLRVPEPHPRYATNTYAVAKYRRYVDELRRYSAYFNPTLRSPMPRARCEPMMCGVVTVNAANHDVERFIENGVDGFYSNDPDELRDQLRHLLRNPAAVRTMGAAARRKAMSVFHVDRYLSDWRTLLTDLGL